MDDSGTAGCRPLVQYCDGLEAEAHILKAVCEATDRSTFSEDLRASIVDWPSEYHLSSRRHCLIRPLGIAAGDRVLELGCGCGAITRYLGEIGAQVCAVEGSETRARIAADRCSDLSNVSIIVGDLLNSVPNQEFDWVLLIGVLEYAPLYCPDDPVNSYIRKAESVLAAEGNLVVAIENKLGLKYFNGCAEDHLNIPYYGIQGLYQSHTPVTLGRQELAKILFDNGLHYQKFYFPFPDYKLPSVIVSDTALSAAPDFDAIDLLAQCHARDYAGATNRSFDEALVYRELHKNALVPELSNSFLVVSARRPSTARDAQLGYAFSAHRAAPFATETTFVRANGCIRVDKALMTNGGAKTTLLRDGASLSHNLHSQLYIPGQQLLWSLLESRARNEGTAAAASALLPWFRFVLRYVRTWPAHTREAGRALRLSSLWLDGSMVDATPFNVIERDGQFAIIDREWVLDRPIPLGWLLTRSVFYCLRLGIPATDQFASLLEVVKRLCQEADLSVEHDEMSAWLKRETEFQSVVLGHSWSVISPEAAIPCLRRTSSQLALLEAANREHKAELQSASERLQEREAQIQALETRLACEAELAASSAGLLQEREAQIQALETKLAREAELAARSAAMLQEHGDQIQNLEAQLSSKSGLLENLHRERVQLSLQVGTAKETIKSLTLDAESRAKELESQRSAVRRVEEELAQERFKALQVQAILAKVHSSLVWRVTSPLRQLRTHPSVVSLMDYLRFLVPWILRFQVISGVKRFRLMLENARLLQEASSLFDGAWYLAQNPDVAASETDSLLHYLLHGANEGRDPNPYFDTDWYLSHYPDVAEVGVNPLVHYYHWGAAEGRDPGPLFETDWYLSCSPDVQSCGVNPLEHYLQCGHREGRAAKPARTNAAAKPGVENIDLRTPIALSRSPRIAVALHVFYEDLLIEMLDATLAIPYPFDLFLSTPSPAIAREAQSWCNEHSRVKLITEVVTNRGRDVAPLMVNFGKRLLGYDAICHVHSKKSLFSGSDQKGWREYLVSSLVGTSEQIQFILSLLIDRKIGVVYPKTYPPVPYLAHTWLSSRAAGEELFSRLGISGEPEGYLDFPVGTMFWACPSAISQLLDGRFQIDDFPEERGQNDGTLAHAVERSLVPLARHNGWSFAEVDFEKLLVRHNRGSKNLEQYSRHSLTDLKNKIDAAAVVSFDIFDTLITRPFVRPDRLFKIMEHRLDSSLKRRSEFSQCRKEAERVARGQNQGGDVGLDSIYEYLSLLDGYDRKLASEAKNLECELEYQISIPRRTVVEAYNYAIDSGKRVLLLSDMYLPSSFLSRLLFKAGIQRWDQLHVSCEVGLRKDTGQLWDWLIDEEHLSENRLLHVGDNEQSDGQMAWDRPFIEPYHVLSPVNLFALSRWGRAVTARLGSTWKEAAYLGPLIATLYNDPFAHVEFD